MRDIFDRAPADEAPPWRPAPKCLRVQWLQDAGLLLVIATANTQGPESCRVSGLRGAACARGA